VRSRIKGGRWMPGQVLAVGRGIVRNIEMKVNEMDGIWEDWIIWGNFISW
jgi:hypothetical protein